MPTPEVQGMMEILSKLENAAENIGNEVEMSDGNVIRSTGRPEVDEMYNILSKLNEATNAAATNVVKQSSTVKSENDNVGIGGYHIVLNKQIVEGFKKTYYTITQDGTEIYENLALFESAMAIVKKLMFNKNGIEKIVDYDNRYASVLLEAAQYKNRMKVITEGVKYDIYVAKHTSAVDKMKNIKRQIKNLM
jgi:hypothetical protein